MSRRLINPMTNMNLLTDSNCFRAHDFGRQYIRFVRSDDLLCHRLGLNGHAMLCALREWLSCRTCYRVRSWTGWYRWRLDSMSLRIEYFYVYVIRLFWSSLLFYAADWFYYTVSSWSSEFGAYSSSKRCVNWLTASHTMASNFNVRANAQALCVFVYRSIVCSEFLHVIICYQWLRRFFSLGNGNYFIVNVGILFLIAISSLKKITHPKTIVGNSHSNM